MGMYIDCGARGDGNGKGAGGLPVGPKSVPNVLLGGLPVGPIRRVQPLKNTWHKDCLNVRPNAYVPKSITCPSTWVNKAKFFPVNMHEQIGRTFGRTPSQIWAHIWARTPPDLGAHLGAVPQLWAPCNIRRKF